MMLGYPEKLLFVVNDPGFFLSHRLPLALAAKRAGYEVHVATPLGESVEKIKAEGLLHHSLPMSRSGKNPLVEMRSLWAMFLLLRQLQPRIVHLVTIKPVLYGGIAARLVGTPAVVAAISGLGFVFIRAGLGARLIRRLVGLLYRFALGHRNLRVIFQNPDDKGSVTQLAGLRPEQTVLIRGSGVDLKRFAGAPWPKEQIVMLAARLLVDKGVREFIEAAQLLRRRGHSARFVLVGTIDEGNPSSLKPTEIEEYVAMNIVEWWGHQAEMSQVLAQAQIVVLPSYREGLPKVLIEAAACGRAVVTTDVPGCRDAIEPGITGLLVPARDARALADAMETLISDPARCRAMGEAGRKLAERAFDVRQVAATHLAVYRELSEKA